MNIQLLLARQQMMETVIIALTLMHTSLTGFFVFNSGQLIQSVNTPYSEMALADSRYEYDNGNDVDLIVKRIKTHNYAVQNNATSAARSINVRDVNSDQLFVIGRNIMLAATGGAFTGQIIQE